MRKRLLSAIARIGTPVSNGPRHTHLPPFATFNGQYASVAEALGLVRAHPHPTDVLADASVFSPERIDLVRNLMLSLPVTLLPEVVEELLQMRGDRTSELRALLFPNGGLNPLLRRGGRESLRGYERVATKLANLLHLRRTFLAGPVQKFRSVHGRDPVGKERTRIIQQALQDGVSQRAVRLANKGDDVSRFTDEMLAVSCVLGPVLTGRDCVVLTADKDVLDHVYELHCLLHEHYGSLLIAESLQTQPDRYTHQHATDVGFMKLGGVAYGREINPEYLLPSAPKTCGAWVINVANLSHVICIATRDVARTLHYQNTSPMQQVADGGDGRNVHMNWTDSRCRRFHFAVGHDTYVRDEQTPLGRICITAHELAFVIGEKRRALVPNGRVWMPGLPRPR